MIDLTRIKLFNAEEIKELIDVETDDHLEIYLPRTSVQFSSSDEKIAYDYASAAYSGQLISENASHFEYKFSPPAVFESYYFKIKGFDSKDLSETLYNISCLYGYAENDDDEENVTIEDVLQFLDDVETGKTSAACAELITIYSEFGKEEED